jgi:hypothetical protein
MLATSVNDEEMAVPKPSIRTVIATIATVGIVMGLWVSSTLVLDLIFHFHPTVLGLAAGWMQRRVGGSPRNAGPALWLALLAGSAVIAGTAVIDWVGGPLDPPGFTAAMTGLGIAAGAYILYRPSRKESTSV